MKVPFTRTKVVVTLGPSSWEEAMIGRLVDAGVDVFRINMSHASIEQGRELVHRIRGVSQTVAVLIDTRGPELRTTEVAEPFSLTAGQRLSLVSGEATDNTTAVRIVVQHIGLARHLAPGVRVYMDDGLIRLVVEEVSSDLQSARCLVERGGLVTSRRGVNVPGVKVFPPELTEADKDAIHMAAAENVDFLAASFVQRADDISAIRWILDHEGADTQVVAKIETRQAVDNIDEILEASDGIMVARGDLGVEIPAEEVPLVQKRLIRTCNQVGKPVIVATQMLESMVEHPVPTRAETSDVANAIMDGTDAVMLSGETAKGRFPIEAVSTLMRVSDFVEAHTELFRQELWRTPAESTQDFISKAVCRATRDLNVDFIVALTASGRTARLVSRYKPPVPILASTPDLRVARQLCLTYGVIPFIVPRSGDFAAIVGESLSQMIAEGTLKLSHRVIVTFGLPMEVPGSTNLMCCDTVERLLGGVGLSNV